jgi:hypothetical protein
MAIDKDNMSGSETIVVKVAPRKSVDVDGKLKGPGTKLTLSLSEARDLYAKGFIVDADDDAAANADENAGADAALSIQIGDQAEQ